MGLKAKTKSLFGVNKARMRVLSGICMAFENCMFSDPTPRFKKFHGYPCMNITGFATMDFPIPPNSAFLPKCFPVYQP